MVDIKEAIAILEEVTGQVNATRAVHLKIIDALNCVRQNSTVAPTAPVKRPSRR